MPPTATSNKIVKPPARDLRSFFGSSSSGQTSLTQSGSQDPTPKMRNKKGDIIEISDDDNGVKNKLKTSKLPATKSALSREPVLKSERVMQMDVDSEVEQLQPSKPTLKRKKPTALLSSDEDEEEKVPPPKKKTVPAPSSSRTPQGKPKVSKSRAVAKKALQDDEFESSSEDDDDDEFKPTPDTDDVPLKGKGRAKEKAKPRAPVKRTPAKQQGTSAQPSPRKASGKVKAAAEESKAPPVRKFDWAAAKAAKLSAPRASGSKEVPDGEPDGLAGLAFVFTGELSSFSREEAVDLAKRFGGRVVGQPSSKTDYVILGDNAGPSKLAAIKKHNLRALSEDEFLNLIATRKGPNGGQLDAKTKKKMEKEQEAIKEGAKEMEKREKQAMKASGKIHAPDTSSQLWTTRYAPQTLKEICGNKGQVEKLQQWLMDWPASMKSHFTKPGKNAMNCFRAVMITGSPGIGKTTSAHLCAKLAGFTPVELNASDARSKKLVEGATNINNTSLDAWMGGPESTNAVGVAITNKTCLIMDEVDGMSAGDRGGVGALNALIKKSKIPIICIANDRGAQKLKPLLATTFNLTFRKPEAAAIRSRILTIAFKEKMKVPANVVDQLVAGAQSDIRQVLNMLSTWKLSNDSITFDEGKNLVKTNEKYTIMTPFDVTFKIMGPYMFSPTARETLGDKMELYFHDHSFVPLFVQENYLKTQPARIRNTDGPEKTLKHLELMDRAAASISDGDLVDALLRGPEQHWSLMPLHAVCSTVRPASFLYGAGSGYGPGGMSFPQWLGQNSKQTKLSRALSDVQIRMRLKVSGDKHEIRQSYLPSLFPHIVRPLMDNGASAVEDVIDFMDEYYISREDWDTIVELGVNENKDEIVLKKISSATKSGFTRKYNSKEHPIPFHKAQDLGKAPKKIAGGAVPDLEEAFDFDDEVIEDASDDEKSGKNADDDISKDKLIQAAKNKKTGAKGSGKAQARDKGQGKK